jgi:hypothetical protein
LECLCHLTGKIVLMVNLPVLPYRQYYDGIGALISEGSNKYAKESSWYFRYSD